MLFQVAAGREIIHPPEPPTAEIAADYQFDPAFYTKATEVQGILLATSERVSDRDWNR